VTAKRRHESRRGRQECLRHGVPATSRREFRGSASPATAGFILIPMHRLTLLLFFAALAPALAQPYDLVIRNGHIVDGTGSPWYAGDVAIRAGKIAAIGHLAGAPARRTIDARGMTVAPGFIDMLGQSELTILVNPHLPSKIYQGITTEITGEGSSIAPLNDAIVRADHVTYEHYGVKPVWRTFGEYFALLAKQGMGINLASYVGATQVRRMVLADEDRAPNAAELERMRGLVRQAMQDGAIGLSTSLQYAPAPYAKTEELIALAAEAAKFGGIYASHIRDEGNGIMGALDEAFRIGREAHIPVEIWHLKAAGKSNWGRMPEIVAHIEQARKSGLDVAANTYAYTAWFNSFSAVIPPWAHDGGDRKLIERLKDPAARARIRREMESTAGDWNNEWQEVPGPESILVCAVQNPKLLPLQGKNIGEIAKLWNKDPIDTVFDLLIQDEAFTEVAMSAMSEADVTLALEQPWVSVCNDSQGTAPDGPLGKEHPHPRAYGTFPRILRKYVREEHKLTLEDAIRKFSALPAARMRLADRGVLKAGMWADLVVFDPEAIRDLATFEQPNQLSEGMRFVLVNGVPVIDEGKMTNALPGKVLRR
jgi:N-acyl-D-aspartate/D-glutamate deacylase